MKKRMTAFLLLTVFIVSSLTGCARSEARKTAEGFLQGIMLGDAEVVAGYASRELMDSGTLVFTDREELRTQLYEELGVSEEDLSEEARESVEHFVDTVVQNVIKEYEITSVSARRGKASVEADIVKGFDSDEYIDPVGEEELQEDIEQYQSEHFDELVEIYTKSGEEAMRLELYNGMVPIILDRMAQKIEEMDEIAQSTTITVEKIDKQWKVTGFDEVSTSSQSGTSGASSEQAK